MVQEPAALAAAGGAATRQLLVDVSVVAAHDAGTAVFVDVRGPGAYAAGRVPGSLLIPLNEFEGRLNELDPQDWIITYCT